MSDKIKEILDNLNKNKNEIRTYCYYPDDVLSCDDLIKLLDYITNLQTIEQQYSAILSENAELENKITDLQDTLKDREEYCYGLETQLTNLQKENKILRQNAKHNDKVVDKAKWNEMLYKGRNKKAIEKLKSIRIFCLRSGKTLFSTLINETIDILNGGDDNE